jgi:hypothetical protein
MQTNTVAHTIVTLEQKPQRRRERGQGGLIKKAGSNSGTCSTTT